ncbi:sensitivity to high expression protein she9 [Pseudocyphellaria aurata]|nr:sensitivity to high expression protein she9 [Pseudocyphellaria aurata]
MDHLQSNIFIAGQRLNDLTGYSGIEALKKEIEEQEKTVRTSRSSLQQAREAYSAAINSRSASQREVNELLQRKHAWTSNDLERFTSLYRSDHANEQSESAAQEQLAATERKAEEAAAKLSASILARYHEEQIWSDKIRRMSTWGTWGLMGVNVLLFLVFQIGVEPWRRKRLVKGFEEKVLEALERETPAMGAATKPHDTQASESVLVSDAAVDGVEKDMEGAVEPELPASMEKGELDDAFSVGQAFLAIESTTAARSSVLDTLHQGLRDLFSDRPMMVRRVDITTVALEGAAGGMALAGLAVLLFQLATLNKG